ncbi:cysteine desulfurase family protein [Pseudalkalibacillus salsuginis]|uniref:cysteine desulfurase family protein n=1 Tax=Pseudalkalibacillus salsuginis TaxID=2910972 RepID=UPI001F2E4A02|nr:cysteine desulfurase family protein [Pseudalkalibacillus salsuginis]MCF6408618.1 cysteine desulfurase [Pseudalkalibacillus salsuginis]
MSAIYLDHAATSPTREEVVEAMVPYFTTQYGNPSSIHQFGRNTRQALDEARRVIASSINANFKEIIFTSGGTESDNMAIIGTALALQEKGKHIITSKVEHHAVLHAVQYLEENGFEVSYLSADEEGRIDPQQVEDAIRDDTILVTIMYGNNEVGTLQPIEEIGKITSEKKVLFHTDAVQAYGSVSIDVKHLGIDLLSVSAHKINGPKGNGFLYVREGLWLEPRAFGGEQERKRRAGTENVPGIMGMKKAVELIQEEKIGRHEQLLNMKKRMLEIFDGEGIEYILNGSINLSLPHVLNVSFPGTNVEAMLVNLDLAGIAASSGSACTAGSIEPSHVLAAMFDDHERMTSAIRFSFGHGNTMEEIEQAAKETVRIVNRLTSM